MAILANARQGKKQGCFRKNQLAAIGEQVLHNGLASGSAQEISVNDFGDLLDGVVHEFESIL